MILDFFHPLIKEWFLTRYSSPTDIQEKGWAQISSGAHVLMTAPTGSGKTMASFLWSLNQLITGAWPTGLTRVLYISPLKALNNDVRRNLLEPLGLLKDFFEERGAGFPQIHVMTRSGDTSSSDRQKMMRKPPEILITTPESLNLLLTSGAARKVLAGVAVVILDEIHGIAGDKRGVHLFSAVERLALACGEFQRIGMSATVHPLNLVASLLGGYIPRTHGEEAVRPRPVKILKSEIKKKYELKLIFPENPPLEESHWPGTVASFVEKIQKNRSTLIFCNSRRQTEKVTRMINELAGETLAFAHHGSLSREIRYFVEQQMKEGVLRCIVATSSLEMGIDIGSIDEVILIQAPFFLSSAIQRIGRGGHNVGDVSRAAVYPMFGMDLIRCAVAGRAVLDGEIEELHVPENPLDVLAQVILSMVCTEEWDLDRLYLFITSVYHWRNLPRRHFDLVLEMLNGRYADSRIGELKPRITMDKVKNSCTAREGTARVLYTSGGTIPDRGYYELRSHGDKSLIGELDEEFVWERNQGDFFTLGTQTWRVDSITDRSVEVTAADAGGAMSPFWKADPNGRDFFYSRKILDLAEHADQTLSRDKKGGEEQLIEEFRELYHMDQEGARATVSYLDRQRKHTEKSLPHRHHMLIEHFNDPLNKTDCHQIILHTLWGGKLNYPYSEALAQAWEDKQGYPLQVFCDDDGVIMDLPHQFEPQDVLSLVTGDNLEKLLRRRLESTLFFGGRFRHNASRALLLPRKSFKQRTPLWLTRLRSKKLLQAVSRYEDFPILTETWRSCFQDDFDLESLAMVLDEIREGSIQVSQTMTRTPSPFASGLVYDHTNQRMYEDDTPLGGESRLKDDLIKGIIHDSGLRPALPAALVREFNAKIQRTWPEYTPGTAQDLVDWVDERIFIPLSQWNEMIQAIDRDRESLEQEERPIYEEAMDHLVLWDTEDSCEPLVISLIYQKKYGKEGFTSEIDTLLPQWINFFGPTPLSCLMETYPASAQRINDCLETLRETELVILDRLTEEGETQEFCTAENLEILFRLKRRKGRNNFKALPLDKLPLFLAQHQRLARSGTGQGNKDNVTLTQVFDQLIAYGAKAPLWETEILPARVEPYYSSHLDTLFQESPLLWYGCGQETLAFCFEEEQSLFIMKKGKSRNLDKLLPHDRGSYTFWDIKEHSGCNSSALMDLLWKECWAGQVSNDHFSTVRRGIGNKFKTQTLTDLEKKSGGRIRRGGYNRWMNTRATEGRWHLTESIPKDEDPIEQDERTREVIRQLFLRYGVLFRQLLEREADHLKWPALFRTLRLMELSGECVGGQFFEGVRSLQFASWETLRELNEPLNEEAVYWMNCTDPASLAGVKMDELRGRFPPRLPSNHMVFRGSKPLLFSQGKGKSLTFHVEPDHCDALEALSFFKVLLCRDFNPLKAVRVEEINGLSYKESPYKPVLERAGFRDNFQALIMNAPV